jgi:hypothetical protein
MNFRPAQERGTRDQPDPVHRRAAGGADLPDAVHHLQQVHRAAAALPVADTDAQRDYPKK